MMKLIIVCATVGFLLVAAATVLLAWLNWSPRLYVPVTTSLLIGVSTGFVSIAMTLKPTHTIRTFAAGVVVFREEVGAPAAIPLTHEAALRLNIGALLNQLPAEDRTARGADAVFTLGLEAAQYALVKLIREIEGGGWATANVGGVTSAVVRSMPPTTVAPVDERHIAEVLAPNRFASIPSEVFYWKHLRFALPPNTRVELYHTPPSPTEGPERRGVRLIKPRFFRIDIQLQPMGIDSGLPAGIDIAEGERARAGTLYFTLRATVEFERLTAGNQRTEEYKAWADWLVGEIASRVSGV